MKKNKARSSNKGEITSISPKQLETIQRQIKISSGPIPSAEELSKYNKIEPELVNRIVSMAENQQNHRLNSEKRHKTWALNTKRTAKAPVELLL